MLHSLGFTRLTQRTFAATGLIILTALPNPASASTVTAQLQQAQGSLTETLNQPRAISQASRKQAGWLIADKDNKDNKKGRGRDKDSEIQVVRVDLNRAKNYARQAAEEANGGIRVYRAEDSMHGPAAQCPYVDNGDSWTFTFLGGRPGTATRTIESVVTVYKNISRVVVDYNGPIRSAQQTQVVSFTNAQRTELISLLRGNCGCNYLLSETLRTQIIGQAKSLPPGIQKQLIRGKGLPPGIAQKLVVLPKQVNTYLKLPTQYDLAVVGSNIVLVNQVKATVVDLISNIL